MQLSIWNDALARLVAVIVALAGAVLVLAVEVHHQRRGRRRAGLRAVALWRQAKLYRRGVTHFAGHLPACVASPLQPCQAVPPEPCNCGWAAFVEEANQDEPREEA